MKKLISLLRELDPGKEVVETTSLLRDGVLDSLGIVSLVTDINDSYGVNIGAEDISPENFESVQTVMSLIERRGGEICR